jgi:PIN domain nuclease of toxin-antitoxin system
VGRLALTSLLLDTHALVWLAAEHERLGAAARTAIADAAESGTLLVSAISFWEIALLIARGRLAGRADAASWRANALASGISEIAITGAIGIAAVGLEGLHADPAHRLVVATALAERATLVTADRRLLGWKGRLARLDAER